MSHTVATKYNPATGKITAKCWNGRIIVDGYNNKNTLGELAAHREAVKVLLKKLNNGDDNGEWTITAAAEGLKAMEYTFIIDYVALPAQKREYRVMWEIYTTADSYESAARWVQNTYFAQGHQGHYEVKARGDVYPVVVDFLPE